jgi:dsRNA-specific ribonuclease
MITPEQVKDVEQLRASVHSLIAKGITDEYLLATYNGIARRLDDRLPNIRKRAEGKDLKKETRELVRQQREATRNRTASSSGPASSSTRKAS